MDPKTLLQVIIWVIIGLAVLGGFAEQYPLLFTSGVAVAIVLAIAYIWEFVEV